MLSTERDKKKRKKVKENYYYFATKKIENQKTSLRAYEPADL